MNDYNMSGFIVSFSLLPLQISASKFQSKSPRGLPSNPFVPSKENCNHWHFGSINILALDCHSFFREERGGRRGLLGGEERVGCDSKRPYPPLLFTVAHRGTMRRPTRKVEDTCHFTLSLYCS